MGLLTGVKAALGLGPRAPLDDAPDRLGVSAVETPPKASRPQAVGAAAPKAAGWRPGWRTAIVALAFAIPLASAAAKLARQADQPPEAATEETRRGESRREPTRAPLVDRHGAPLAGPITTFDLYLDLSGLATEAERDAAAGEIARALPQVDLERLRATMRGASGTITVSTRLTPLEVQRAHELGIPGLYPAPRRDRLYFAGEDAAHLIGWTSVDGLGQSGVEGGLDEMIREPGQLPIALSIDLRIQIAARETLQAAIERTSAAGGAAVVLSPQTGEVLALVSLPTFSPHDQRLLSRFAGAGPESPLFNRAVTGLYELGSTMKIVTWALALHAGVAEMTTLYDPPQPFRAGGHTIDDAFPIREPITFQGAFARSSNIIAARLALAAGRPAQYRMFELLGLHATPTLEVTEARGSAPRWYAPWSDSTTAATSYGHAVQLSPLQLAEAVASLVGGGERVRATILRQDPALLAAAEPPVRVVSAETSRQVRELMRLVVTDGTARSVGFPPALDVGGKTGTADKARRDGRGYHTDRVVSTFVGAFPMSQPRAVVVVMLDEPSVTINGRLVRSASRTAAPAARALIERIAPLLGVAPLPGR